MFTSSTVVWDGVNCGTRYVAIADGTGSSPSGRVVEHPWHGLVAHVDYADDVGPVSCRRFNRSSDDRLDADVARGFRVITTPPHGPASGVLNSRPAAGGMIRVSSVREVNGVATNDIARRGRSAVSNSNDCQIGRLPGTVAAQANEVADATSCGRADRVVEVAQSRRSLSTAFELVCNASIDTTIGSARRRPALVCSADRKPANRRPVEITSSVHAVICTTTRPAPRRIDPRDGPELSRWMIAPGSSRVSINGSSPHTIVIAAHPMVTSATPRGSAAKIIFCASSSKRNDGTTLRDPERENRAGGGARDGDHQAVGQHLADQLFPAGADRHPHRGLARPRRGAREQERRDVRAGDREHRDRSGPQQLADSRNAVGGFAIAGQ